MSGRNETTERKQLAEFGAVSVVTRRNPEVPALETIKWIRERKVITSHREELFIMWFLFWIDNKRHTMTAVIVALTLEEGKWRLCTADVDSEFQAGKDHRETWKFLPDGTLQKIS